MLEEIIHVQMHTAIYWQLWPVIQDGYWESPPSQINTRACTLVDSSSIFPKSSIGFCYLEMLQFLLYDICCFLYIVAFVFSL